MLMSCSTGLHSTFASDSRMACPDVLRDRLDGLPGHVSRVAPGFNGDIVPTGMLRVVIHEKLLQRTTSARFI